MEQTLLLDAHFRPLGIICWQKALALLFQAKAEVVTKGNGVVRSVSQTFQVPLVLRLLKQTYRKYKVSFSKRRVYLRDNGKCAYCSIELRLNNFTIDHVIPRSRGGTNSWENVVCCCRKCNNRKGARLSAECNMPLVFNPRVPAAMELILKAVEFGGFSMLDIYLKT